MIFFCGAEGKRMKCEFSFCGVFITHIVCACACAYRIQRSIIMIIAWVIISLCHIASYNWIWMEGFLCWQDNSIKCGSHFCGSNICYCLYTLTDFPNHRNINESMQEKNRVRTTCIHRPSRLVRRYVIEKNEKFWKIFEMSFHISDCHRCHCRCCIRLVLAHNIKKCWVWKRVTATARERGRERVIGISRNRIGEKEMCKNNDNLLWNDPKLWKAHSRMPYLCMGLTKQWPVYTTMTHTQKCNKITFFVCKKRENAHTHTHEYFTDWVNVSKITKEGSKRVSPGMNVSERARVRFGRASMETLNNKLALVRE